MRRPKLNGKMKRVVAKSKGVGYIISRPDNAFPWELLAELGRPAADVPV